MGVLCSQASSMGSFPLALVIVQREGFGAFFRGFAPNLLGVTHGTLQFSLYEAMKARYRTFNGETFVQQTFNNYHSTIYLQPVQDASERSANVTRNTHTHNHIQNIADTWFAHQRRHDRP